MKTKTKIYFFISIILMAILIWTASVTGQAKNKWCAKSNCYKSCAAGSNYCSKHRSTSSTKSGSKKTYHSSYDDGYNAVYDDGDYSWSRYQNDWDYALGVDDALDDWDEYGEDW